MFFCVCWVDKTTVTHNNNSGQALLSPRRTDGSGTFARVHEQRERTNSMHRNSKREAFAATLAVYTCYKVQSLLSLGVRQNQSLFARVGRGNASCWESGVSLAKASTVAGQRGQKLWTPYPWYPAVAGWGWQKSNKTKTKNQSVFVEKAAHIQDITRLYVIFLLNPFPFFSLYHCFLFFSFSFTCVF